MMHQAESLYRVSFLAIASCARVLFVFCDWLGSWHVYNTKMQTLRGTKNKKRDFTTRQRQSNAEDTLSEYKYPWTDHDLLDFA